MSDFERFEKEKKIHTAGNRNFHEKTTTSNTMYFPNQKKNEVLADEKVNKEQVDNHDLCDKIERHRKKQKQKRG